MTDKPEMTEIKTMWSESLLESLYVALRKTAEDKVVLEVLDELKAKEYDDDYIINKAKRKVGPAAGERVEALLAGKSTNASTGKPEMSKADIARANAAKKRGESGLVGKLKGMFGKD